MEENKESVFVWGRNSNGEIGNSTQAAFTVEPLRCQLADQVVIH
jgi:hypothetical protein